MRSAYFWEREDAEAVAERLAGDVRRGRFHGEDDDEDHPWVVDLPDHVAADLLDGLLTEYDGWLEPGDDELVEPADHQPAPPPPPLPTEPRRLKNAQRGQS